MHKSVEGGARNHQKCRPKGQPLPLKPLQSLNKIRKHGLRSLRRWFQQQLLHRGVNSAHLPFL